MHRSVYRNRDKKIPTPLAIIIAIFFVGFLGVVFNKQSFKGDQKKAVEISRSEIANLRDTTVTIYWRTEQAVKGAIFFSNDQARVDQQLFDDRDVDNQPLARKNHIMTIKNLTPNTNYHYRIALDGVQVGQTDHIPFSFKTTRPVTSALDIDPLYGKVVGVDGRNLSDAVVLLTIQKTLPLVTTTKIDGSFLYAPCCIFSADKVETYYPSGNDMVTLEIISEDGQVKKISSNLGEMSPYQNSIAMGQKEETAVLANHEESNEPLLAADQVEKLDPIDIMFPKANSAIPNSRPLIKGVGVPDTTIKGKIEPDGKIFEARIDSERNWQFSLPFDLSPGKHSLKINTTDASGKLLTLSRTFTTLKSGEAVLGDATGSATITPQVTITETLTATPFPTEIVTLSPTIIDIAPTDVTSTPPITGNSALPFITMSVALIILGAGLLIIYQ